MSVRLLVPPHSPLAEAPEASAWLGALDPANFSYRWQHPDPRMDELFSRVTALVSQAGGETAPATHARIREMAYAAAGRQAPALRPAAPPAPGRVPRLTEDWFCCAEPTRTQVDLIQL
jgi:hypothetical protein